MICLNNITKRYKYGDVETLALDHVNLTIQDGEMVAIMGPSGSGKSTLLNIIGLMDTATEGQYLYRGDDKEADVTAFTRKQSIAFRKEHVGFIFQNFALLKDYTVYENVEIPLRARNIPLKERRERIDACLKALDISNLANKRPTRISGGQQQRVAIARALVIGADLILADEPTGALDQKTGEEIMKQMMKLHDEKHTILLVTHDQHIAEYADRIIYIEDGKIII